MQCGVARLRKWLVVGSMALLAGCLSRGEAGQGMATVQAADVEGVRVWGRVLDTRGRPAAGRVLEWSVLAGAAASAPPGAGPGRIVTDRLGMFEAPRVVPGRYALVVYAPSPLGGDRCMQQVPIRGRVLDVSAGARVQEHLVLVHAPEEFAIAGKVADADGRPVAGIVVDTFIPHGRHWWTKTDAQGGFRIEGLDGMGTSAFRVYFNGVPGAAAYSLSIPDVPLHAAGVNLVIPAAGTVRGSVFDASTRDPVGTCTVSVPAVRLSDSGAIWEGPDVAIAPESDGRFAIAGVPAGEATVEIRAPGWGAQRFIVTVPAGGTAVLDGALRGPAVFAGRTTRNGKPEPVSLVIHGEWLRPDDNGRFHFAQFPNGPLSAWAFVHDGWHRTIRADLRSGETVWVDIEAGGRGEIRGSVHFPDLEEPWCTVRLAARPAPDGWLEVGRPDPEDDVLAYEVVRESGGAFRLRGIPAGRWYLMAGRYRPSMHRSLPGIVREIEVGEGEIVQVDLHVDAEDTDTPP